MKIMNIMRNGGGLVLNSGGGNTRGNETGNTGGHDKRSVRSLAVTCELCHHQAVVWADAWPDAVLVQGLPAAHGVHPVRDRRRRRTGRTGGSSGRRENDGANFPRRATLQ